MSNLEKVISIIARETSRNPFNLGTDTRLDSLGIDSLDFLELIRMIEGEFNCTIADEQYAQLHTIGDLLAVL